MCGAVTARRLSWACLTAHQLLMTMFARRDGRRGLCTLPRESVYDYADLLGHSTFSLVVRGHEAFSYRLLEVGGDGGYERWGGVGVAAAARKLK